MIKFTLLVFIFVSISNCDCEKNACSLKLCKCLQRKVECSDTNLTYIPVLPSHTRKLFFDGNYLPLINRHTFSNITHLRHLDVLTLQSCHITNITTNTFKFFKKLSNLRLSYNPLTTGSLLNLFSDLKNSLYYSLMLIDIGLKYIPNGLFKNNFTLFYLDLSKNSLKTLNFTEFNSLDLKILKVENNLIEIVAMDKMENLRNLSLMSNNIKSLPDFCHGNLYFPLLTYLNIQTNQICEYVPRYMNCLKKLSKLVLDNNSISSIQSGSFQELSSLTELSLSQQKGSSLKLQKYSFNNKNLANLKLFDNNMKIKSLNQLAFSGCPRLKYLIISGNYLSDPGRTTCTKLRNILSELNFLQHLDLSKNRLNEVPKSIQNMTKLQYLTLYEDGISTWKNRFWDRSIKLTTLDLGKNSIRKISKDMFPAELRSQLKTISLQFNPIECICDNVWLIEWINSDHKKIKYFPRGYNCLNMTRRVCLRNNPIYSSITGVSCVLLLIFIIVSIYYKYRWFIKYQIYIWRHQPKLLNNMAERQYLYDVFVSYSAQDKWVLNDLVPQLEENEGMKLCIHERDFQAGRLIIDNIVESIETSRRVLIILSNNFARSEWCQFEMTLAQKNVLNRAIEPLSVVLLEVIDSENMSNSLQALLKTTTYITWFDDIEYIHLFWDRLKNSLR